MAVDDLLQLFVDLIPLGQQFIQFRLPGDAAQGSLRKLGGGITKIFHCHDGLFRIDHPEIHHRIHLNRDVIQGDYILSGHVEHDGAQAHLHHPVDDRDQNDQPRPFGVNQPAQTEDHPALILAQNPDRANEQYNHDQ